MISAGADRHDRLGRVASVDEEDLPGVRYISVMTDTELALTVGA